MDDQAQQIQSDSIARFRRKRIYSESLFCSLSHSGPCLEIFGVVADKLTDAASTPLPNLDDDLSVQKFISDRRVIGVWIPRRRRHILPLTMLPV